MATSALNPHSVTILLEAMWLKQIKYKIKKCESKKKNPKAPINLHLSRFVAPL